MLLNNVVKLNNVMMLWGEFNMEIMKCNYQSKEQYDPNKNINMVLELG